MNETRRLKVNRSIVALEYLIFGCFWMNHSKSKVIENNEKKKFF